MRTRRSVGPAVRTVGIAAALGAVVVGLELWGIGWGLPDLRHVRSFHPDEWRVIEAAERIRPLEGKILPGFYNYGTLYIYALWAVFNLLQGLGLVDAHPLPGTYDANNQALITLAARGLTVVFSVATVLITWKLGERLYGSRVGLIGAGLLAVSPLLIIHSHYAAVDVPATCWVTAAMLGCARVLRQPEGDLARNRKRAGPSNRIPACLILGAAAAGLAAGTKYNTGLVILASWLSWYWHFKAETMRRPAARPMTNRARRLHFFGDLVYGWLVLAAAAFGVFLICTPGFLLDRKQFVSDFWFELWHSSTGHGYVFTRTAPGFIYHITRSLWLGLGPPLCVLAVAGVILAIVRRSRSDALMGIFVLPYYVLIGMAQVKFMRYTIPMLPFLCIWAARLLIAGMRSALSNGGAPPTAARKWMAAICLVVAGGYALLETVAYDRVLATEDTRDRAADWFIDQVPARDTVGMVDTPWFDSPPLVSLNTHMDAARLRALDASWRYRFVITGWNRTLLEKDRPHYFVLDEWQTRYLVRLHKLDPAGHSKAARDARQAAEFLQALGRLYHQAATFSSPPALGPFVFRQGFVPEDWLYPDPVVWVYEVNG